ncbi:hypothetical protein L1987_45896 [Smallanthus sonchifolius]|uniref:Uncharacterized protein n=1 Tax=Smallanthus sonchifolius TaxID=185202 RepID=A0ACB9FY20_9ASTR|nr:hypothetical protein L1987_45896 [Smallanthus sonchifolius]
MAIRISRRSNTYDARNNRLTSRYLFLPHSYFGFRLTDLLNGGIDEQSWPDCFFFSSWFGGAGDGEDSAKKRKNGPVTQDTIKSSVTLLQQLVLEILVEATDQALREGLNNPSTQAWNRAIEAGVEEIFGHSLYNWRKSGIDKILEGAKLIGAGATTIASAGAAIGIGNVLSSSIHSVARNPSLAKQSGKGARPRKCPSSKLGFII